MKLEAVVTCVSYSDFLAHSLPRNKVHFNRIVVVTSPDDVDTQRVCESEHVKCVVTDAFGDDFHKARAINAGLAELDLNGWVVHLDADIVLPPLFRDTLESARLDPSHVYGCDRYMIEGYDAWEEHVRHPKLLHEDSVYVHADAYKLGTRIAPPDHNGYIPIGFFQLWRPGQSGIDHYPDEHSSAGRTDMLFSLQWPRDRRNFLPEIIVYHLESDPDAVQGANWSGRTTPPFAPERGGKIRRWARRHRCWRRRRHHHKHEHPVPPRPEPTPYYKS